MFGTLWRRSWLLIIIIIRLDNNNYRVPRPSPTLRMQNSCDSKNSSRTEKRSEAQARTRARVTRNAKRASRRRRRRSIHVRISFGAAGYILSTLVVHKSLFLARARDYHSALIPAALPALSFRPSAAVPARTRRSASSCSNLRERPAVNSCKSETRGNRYISRLRNTCPAAIGWHTVPMDGNERSLRYCDDVLPCETNGCVWSSSPPVNLRQINDRNKKVKKKRKKKWSDTSEQNCKSDLRPCKL